MTANQIAYWSLEESKRANQTKERETERSNRAKETETRRSNLVNEKIKNRDSIWGNINNSVTAVGKLIQPVSGAIGGAAAAAKLLLV